MGPPRSGRWSDGRSGSRSRGAFPSNNGCVGPVLLRNGHHLAPYLNAVGRFIVTLVSTPIPARASCTILGSPFSEVACMQVFRKDGFRMSISDTARQLMLVAHGAWDPSDGNVKFPKDVRVIHFYAVHQELGKIGAAYAVLDAHPADAYRGIADPVTGVTAR